MWINFFFQYWLQFRGTSRDQSTLSWILQRCSLWPLLAASWVCRGFFEQVQGKEDSVVRLLCSHFSNPNASQTVAPKFALSLGTRACDEC